MLLIAFLYRLLRMSSSLTTVIDGSHSLIVVPLSRRTGKTSHNPSGIVTKRSIDLLLHEDG
jgi:hypothetical protein